MWSLDDWKYVARTQVTDPTGREWSVAVMDLLGQEGDPDMPNQWQELDQPVAYGPSFTDLPVNAVYPFYSLRGVEKDRTDTSPPPGALKATSTPLERVTGIISLSGLMATSERALGFMRPTSISSTEPRTEGTSTSPTGV